MGVWGLDIYDDDLAVDLKSEFEDYLNEGMEAEEAIEELINNNDNLLEEREDMGTFILTTASIAKEYGVANVKIVKMLKMLENSSEYWNNIKEESEELYDARCELFRELM